MQEQSTLTKKHEEIVKNAHRQHRRDFFERRRPVNIQHQQSLSYLSQFDEPMRHQILESLTQPIPQPLPIVTTQTISYYRRANQHFFFPEENGQANPHLIYESLWMLTLAKPEDYSGYPQLAQYFEQHFPTYLRCGWPQIVQMAVIVAGNHVLGRKEDILPFATNDNFWVWANHIIEGKLGLDCLFEQLLADNEKAYELLYQFSNCKDVRKNNTVHALLQQDQQPVLEHIVAKLDCGQPLHESCLRIAGNLMMAEQCVDRLLQLGILSQLEKMLNSKKRQVREEVCWVLSNIATGTEFQATTLLNSSKLVARLLSLLESDVLQVKVEIMYILAGLVGHANPKQVFTLLLNERAMLENVAQLAQEDHSHLQQVVVGLLEGIKKLARMQMDPEEGTAYMHTLERYGFGRLVDLDLTSCQVEK